MDLDLARTENIHALLLVASRIGGLLLIAPVFSTRRVPVRVRTSLLVVLTMLMVPTVPIGDEVVLTLGAVLSETLIGFAIGLGAAVLVGGAEAAGDLIAIQTGLAGSASIDPISHTNVPTLGQFMHLFAIAILFSLDMHIVLIDSVAMSLSILPVGTIVDWEVGLHTMIGMGSTLFVLGIRLAAPIIAAVLLANISVGILSRAAPTLNILAVVFPVQIGVGLFVISASLPYIASALRGIFEGYDAMVLQLLDALSSGGIV